MSKTYRQGVVLLQRVLMLPHDAQRRLSEEEARIILAYGETFGHVHAVSTAFAQLYVGNNGAERFIVTTPGARLVADGHPALELGPGVYKILEPVDSIPPQMPLSTDSGTSIESIYSFGSN